MANEIKSLKDLYLDNLKDLYSAESQVTKALPKIIETVSSSHLKKGLESHLQETKQQVERLNQIFQNLGYTPTSKKCVGMEGVLKEGKEVMEEKMSSPALMDAALIGACQKVEHYEISAYGTARAYAELVGDMTGVDLLTQSLEEEAAADEKLTQIGSTVNQGALNGKKK